MVPGGLTCGTNGGASLSRQIVCGGSNEGLGEAAMEDLTVVIIVVVGVIRVAGLGLDQVGVLDEEGLEPQEAEEDSRGKNSEQLSMAKAFAGGLMSSYDSGILLFRSILLVA